MEKLGNLFEFFVTTGIKTMDQGMDILNLDLILQSTQQPNRKDVAILTIFPNPVERKMNPILTEIGWWCFPQGVKSVREGDKQFAKIEEYYKSEDNNLAFNDINYFIVNDFKGNMKYYCTSALFYEKMFLIAIDEKLIQVYVPKSFCVISKYPAFIPQRSFVMQLLKIQKLRLSQNKERDKIIKIQRGQKEYQIEEIKLYDFYIRTALNQCPIVQDNVEIRLKFSSSEIWMNYFISNSYLMPQHSIFRLSNNLFDVLVFNQPVYNLYKLQLYMMLEYQIIFVSRKPAGITLFCQSLIELMAPLQWKGLFIPFLKPGTFDFQKSNLPYIIGLDRNFYEITEKPLPKELKRVIYDIDDGRIISKSDDPKCPKMFQNYVIRKLNAVFADLKFFENEYFEEGILKYRQAFYNFKLLLLNDIYRYFSSEQKQDSDKKVVLFDYKRFLSSFESADQPFFLQFLKTLTFQQFVKDLYKVMEYREDYIQMNSQNLEYSFSALLQFFDDIRFLMIRFNNQTLDDKLVFLESIQEKYIKEVLDRHDEQSRYKVMEMTTTDFIPEYLEHLKGSSLNLSTEMQALAKYVQVVQEPEPKVDIKQGGPAMQRSLSQEGQDDDNLSQVSSKLSNEEVVEGNQVHIVDERPANQNVNWDINTVGSKYSSISQDRQLYQVRHLNLVKRRHHLRKMNLVEGDDPEEGTIQHQNNHSILMNLADKNMLSNVEPAQSMAAKSYFNKSMMPLIGDYGNAEILIPQHQNDMI